MRCLCWARISRRAEDEAWTEGGASGGIGVDLPLLRGQLAVAQKAPWPYLERADAGSLKPPCLRMDSSLSAGLRRSILVGLRGRGEW